MATVTGDVHSCKGDSHSASEGGSSGTNDMNIHGDSINCSCGDHGNQLKGVQDRKGHNTKTPLHRPQELPILWSHPPNTVAMVSDASNTPQNCT